MKEVSKLTRLHNVSVLGLLETKVKDENIDFVKTNMLPHWDYLINKNTDTTSCIWVTWNPEMAKVTLIEDNHQILHVRKSR